MTIHTPNPEFTILALETSCDETAAAVVRGGVEVLANVVASQLDELRRYGGVVPEVASRQHILALDAVVDEAVGAIPSRWDGIHAIAATNGPGLSSALLTGLNAAKGIAFARGLPFVGVNHIEAHIYANWLATGDRLQGTGDSETGDQAAVASHLSRVTSAPAFPLVALVVSGGHTLLVLLEGHGRYRLLGQTRDDAAGEAFDKSARMLGLGFPGGPAIEQAAQDALPGITLPRAWLRDSYDFSFSGLKTAVLHQVQAHDGSSQAGSIATKNLPKGNSGPKSVDGLASTVDTFTAQLAHAFQESVVDVLVTKTVDAAREFGATEVLLAGGVAANTRLRAEMTRRSTVPVRYPPLSLCTDNAAMVAAAAYYRFEAGVQSGWNLDVNPNLRLGMSE